MNAKHTTSKLNICKTSFIGIIVLAFVFSGFQTVKAETEDRQSESVRPISTPRAQEIRKDAQADRNDIRQVATSTRRNIIQTSRETAENIREENKDARKDIIEANGRSTTTSALLRAQQFTANAERKENRASTTSALKENRAAAITAFKANRTELKNDIQEKRDELKKKIEARKNEKKQRLDEKKRENVVKALENIFKRLDGNVEKVVTIDGRLTTKINELQVAGTDVSDATALITSAKEALSKAQIDIAAAQALANEQAATSTSKEILKSLINTAEESVKSAVSSYRKVAEGIQQYLGSQSTKEDEDESEKNTETSN